jgi:small GTP-binding protein
METSKCLFVGDDGVGKTCLLIRYTTGKFPDDFIPTTLPDVVVKNAAPLLLADTAESDHNRLRLLAYQETAVLVICFSVVSMASYDSVQPTFMPEAAEYLPTVPILLVGTQTDLRDDPEAVARLAEQQLAPLIPAEGHKLAKEIGAVKYLECSARLGVGVNKVFDEIAQIALQTQMARETERQEKCAMM